MELTELVNQYDVIVVEGYDLVGKSTVIERLRVDIGAKIYRPDYNYWQGHHLPKQYRWVIGAGFFDGLSSRAFDLNSKLIIDRGILSGMVYTTPSAGKGYKELLQRTGLKVLHLLITTDRESYEHFCSCRNTEEHVPYEVVVQKSKLFLDYANLLGLDFVTVSNKYDESYARLYAGKCASCGHYSYGVCTHPMRSGTPVDPSQERCDLSKDKEVQDK